MDVDGELTVSADLPSHSLPEFTFCFVPYSFSRPVMAAHHTQISILLLLIPRGTTLDPSHLYMSVDAIGVGQGGSPEPAYLGHLLALLPVPTRESGEVT